MILQKCSFYFCIISLVTLCYGNVDDFWITSELDQDNLQNFRQDLKYDNPSVNVNKIFDQILPKIREILVSKGWEPVNLPNFDETNLPILGPVKGKINLRNGYLHYLTDVKRSKNVTMQYNNKNLYFDLPLRWQLLSLNYDYHLTYLFFKKQGEVYGRIDEADFDVKLNLNLKNYELSMQGTKIHRIHSFDLKVEGNKSDPIMNMLTSAMSRFFKNRIVTLIEDSSQKLLVPLIDSLNQKIRKPKSLIT